MLPFVGILVDPANAVFVVVGIALLLEVALCDDGADGASTVLSINLHHVVDESVDSTVAFAEISLFSSLGQAILSHVGTCYAQIRILTSGKNDCSTRV